MSSAAESSQLPRDAAAVETACREMRTVADTPGRPGFRARLAALEHLSDRLLARDAGVWRGVPPAGLAFLAAFLRASSLEETLRRELPVEALERFVAREGRKSLRLVPKGLACHWVAGNVPLVGLYSWAMSAVVGNANVIRLSSRQDDIVSPVLELLTGVSDVGRAMAAETRVVQFDREARPLHEAMSAVADVRLAWGGREAVESILSLPTSWECDTIVLGPRVSLAVVDPAVATPSVVGRLVSDIVYFDQLACSSPQCVFVKGRLGEAAFDGFVDAFTAAFAAQSASIPRHVLDFGETFRIQLDRSRVALDFGRVRHDEGTTWTVTVVERPNDAVLCANRFVQVVPYLTVADVCAQIPRNIQTVVIVLDDEEAEALSEAAAHRGVCRFPRAGQGNHFESPWDGAPIASRLTRWVVRTDGSGPRPVGAR
ncbi:MAG: acyl-CoA reductase [Vicinamibacterales bacterium]